MPVFIVINKKDLCSAASLQQTIRCLIYLIKYGSVVKPLEFFNVKTNEDLLKAANMFVDKSICPIFTVSCVTGENIDLLKKFLNILPPRLTAKEQERLSQLPVEFRVDFFLLMFT
jgi:GTPase